MAKKMPSKEMNPPVKPIREHKPKGKVETKARPKITQKQKIG